MEHDTGQIRSAAKQIGNVASTVGSIASKNLGGISGSISPQFKGEAADALIKAVSDVTGDLNRLSAGLNSIRDTLNAYAAHLEWLDRQAAEAIKRNQG